MPFAIAGTEEQKREWLPPLVDEVLLTSFALTEPNAGSDLANCRTRAERGKVFARFLGDKQVIGMGVVQGAEIVP